MSRQSCASENMEFLRGGPGGLGIEPREDLEIPAVETVVPSTKGEEHAAEVVDELREREIESWMENIKNFIRNIDVKTL